MQLKQKDFKHRSKRFFSCLTMLTMLFSFFWMALPGTASAGGTPSATSLTVKLNTTTVATYLSSDLENMTPVKQGYSSIDSMPAPCLTAARGVKVTDILTRAGIDVNSIENIKFKSTDGYTLQLARQYLLDIARYYYPNISSNWDTENNCPDDAVLSGGIPVEPILALVSYYERFGDEPNFDLMDDSCSLRLCFGQDPDNIADITSSKFAKYVNEIDVDGNLLAATSPILTTDTVNNTVGCPITLAFTHDAAWCAAIKDITINGSALASSQYSVTAGAITIDAGAFTSAGTYNIVVKADGYIDASVVQSIRALPLQATVTMNLSKSKVTVGESVTVSGTATPYDWVAIKVLDSAQNIVVFDATAADGDGKYSLDFIIPSGVDGNLTVVAGSGSNVANKTIILANGSGIGGGGGGGGGSSATLQPVTSTSGTATITPSAGGTISLGSEVKIMLPANALMEKDRVEVKIEKTTVPSNIPAGFKLAGDVYEFSVDGQSSYNFNKNVTLTFNFDPSVLSQGKIPSVYYYDEAQSRWVNLGGTVSGSAITVQVDHLTKYAVLVEKEIANVSDITMKDIAGHWAEGNINELMSLGAIAGYPDGAFRPDNSITRAEFATVLAKAFKLAPQNGKVFTDTANHWARDYIATAAANGIVSGYDDSAFGPDDLITREQMAVMVIKAAGLSTAAGETSFADSGNISVWAGKALAAAAEKGIMSGYPDNTIKPQANATRAEAVTVIANALK